MNKISGNKSQSVVQIFINTAAMLCMTLLSTSSLVLAAEFDPLDYCTDVSDKKLRNKCLDCRDRSCVRDIVKKDEKNDSSPGSDGDKCSEKQREIDDAERNIARACKDGGLGGGENCVASAKRCDEVEGDESYASIGSFAQALGVDSTAATAMSALGSTSACPQFGGRDYFTEKKNIEDDIKDLQKELAELNDDKADVEKKFNDTNNDIQEELSNAQKELKEKSADIDEKMREQISDFNKNQMQQNDQLRQKSSELLRLRGNLISSQRDKALKLIAVSEASGKSACMKAVNDAKKNYEAYPSNFAESKRKKDELIRIFNDCMETFNQQRVALNESKKQEQDALNKQIEDAQSTMDEIQNSLNLAQSQLSEIQQAAKQKKDDATQSLTDLTSRSQQKLMASYQQKQDNLTTIQAKSQNIQQALNRANMRLMQLGPAPKSRTSNSSPYDVSAEIESELEIIDRVKRMAPNCKFDSRVKTRSSRSSKAVR